MPVKPETKLVQRIVEYVRTNGGMGWHVPGSTKVVNQPDIDGAIPRQDGSIVHFKVEAKMPGQEPRLGQQAMLQLWGSLGYTTGVVHSLSEFMELIENAKVTVRPSQIITPNAALLPVDPSEGD